MKNSKCFNREIEETPVLSQRLRNLYVASISSTQFLGLWRAPTLVYLVLLKKYFLGK